MSDEKFIPGPWNNCDGETIETKEARICIVAPLNLTQEESDANAALISAAPEMYEFGETTAEVLQLLISYLGPKASGLNAEIKRLAEERISEWQKIEKKAGGGND